MKNLIPLILAFAFVAFAADKPAAAPTVTISAEDKLAVREAQISAQQGQLIVLDLSNKILQANAQLQEKQKAAQDAQAALKTIVTDVTEKLRKSSGCKECVINEDLTFAIPPPPPAK